MRVVGKCVICGRNGYVNNMTNHCRKCQNKQDSG